MGIVLFLQMEQRNTNGTLSNENVSSLYNSTDAVAPSIEIPLVNATISPAKVSVPPTATAEKIVLETKKAPTQQKIVTQEMPPTQQKADVQQKTPVQEKAPLQVTTQKVVASPTPSDKKTSIPQAKEITTKTPVAKSTPLPAAKTDTSSGATGTHEMSSLAVELSGSTVHIIIKANTPFAYKTMLLSSPDRLVIDLPGTWKKIATTTTPKNRLVEKIRIGNQPAGPRMVLDLKMKPKKYDIYKRDTSTLEIVIE